MATAKAVHKLALTLALGLSFAPLSARAELEFSVYGGPQTTHPSWIRSPTLGDDRVIWRSEPFVIPTYYGLRAKWWSKNRFGFGLDFVHYKAFADDPAKYGYEELNFSHGLNALTLDLWYRNDAVGKVTPYIGAGLGVVVPHVEAEPIGQEPTANYQIAGPAMTLVFGATMPLSGNWSAFTEYKVTYSEIRAKLDTGDRLNTNIFADALNLGISLRF
jgi:lipid A oxidase